MKGAAKLVRMLHSFQTRSRAMDELIWMGEAAVDTLVEVLGNRSGAVRWAAIKCLSDIGDERAVEPLIGLLDSPSDRSNACDALARLTGQKQGQNADAWQRWWQKESGQAPEEGAAPAEEPSDEDLVQAAVTGLEADVAWGKKGASLTIALPKDRRQKVQILASQKDPQGSALVIVYSECAPAAAAQYEWALRRNLHMPYGALAIRESSRGPMFVMFNTLLRQGLSPTALRKSILAVARGADAVEKGLTGEDKR